MRELSAVLGTIAFIKRDNNKEMIFAHSLGQRKRRQVTLELRHVRVRRAAAGKG